MFAKCQSLLSLLPLISLATATPSSKRGLAWVNPKDPQDNSIWSSSASDLTWYYNYAADPVAAYEDTKLQYIPMLWGAPQSTSDTTFSDTVTNRINSGKNVSYLLFLNEPDGPTSTGGSNVDPTVAADLWKREMEPFSKRGIKLGGPAVTGAPGGFVWLQKFFTACAGNCTVDFLPVHWYGNFEGLASHLGQVYGTYRSNISDYWITEFAFANAKLTDSVTFYNQTSSYLDRLNYTSHYSYFGAFRSSVSNVGPNAAFLTQDGKLTDIGSFYLGQGATNNTPNGAAETTRALFSGFWLLVVGGLFWTLA